MIPLRTHPVGTPLSRGRKVAAELEFVRGGTRTHLAHQITPHPFHITRPFHLADDPEGMATLYLQSSSGGLYGDDDLSLSIRVGEGAAAQITTQASTVVHHARGGASQMRVEVAAAEGAFVEYLPDPAILFAGARLDTSVALRMCPGARAILCDAVLCHDPQGDNAPFERLTAETVVVGPEGPLLIDRIDVEGRDWTARTGDWPCHATLIVAGEGSASAVAPMRAALGSGLWAGVSAFADRDVAIARVLAADGAALTLALRSVWAAAREALTGQTPLRRRK